MSFWGVLIKADSPYTLHHDPTGRRLRISQATLEAPGLMMNTRRVVRCSVGEEPPILICALTPRESTSCQLDLEFQESQDVVFSSTGPNGVHLAGYYLPPNPKPATNNVTPPCIITHQEKEDAEKTGSLGAEDTEAANILLPSHESEENQRKHGSLHANTLSIPPTLHEPLAIEGTAEQANEKNVVPGDLNVTMISCNEVTPQDLVNLHSENGLSKDERIVEKTDDSAYRENQRCRSAPPKDARELENERSDGKSTNDKCTLNNCHVIVGGIPKDQDYVSDSWTSDEHSGVLHLTRKLTSVQVGNLTKKWKKVSDIFNEEDEIGNNLLEEMTNCKLNDGATDTHPRGEMAEKTRRKRKITKVEKVADNEKEHQMIYHDTLKTYDDWEALRSVNNDVCLDKSIINLPNDERPEIAETPKEMKKRKKTNVGRGDIKEKEHQGLHPSNYNRADDSEYLRVEMAENPRKERKRKKVEKVADKEKEHQAISHNTLKTNDNSEILSHFRSVSNDQAVRDDLLPSPSSVKVHDNDVKETNKISKIAGIKTSKVIGKNIEDSSVGFLEVTQRVITLKDKCGRSVNNVDVCLDKSVRNLPNDERLEIAHMQKETKKRKKIKVEDVEDKRKDGSVYSRPSLTHDHVGETPTPSEVFAMSQKEDIKEKGKFSIGSEVKTSNTALANTNDLSLGERADNIQSGAIAENEYGRLESTKEAKRKKKLVEIVSDKEKEQSSKIENLRLESTKEMKRKTKLVEKVSDKEKEQRSKIENLRSSFIYHLTHNASVPLPSFEVGCTKDGKEKKKSSKGSRIKTLIDQNYKDNGEQIEDVTQSGVIPRRNDRPSNTLASGVETQETEVPSRTSKEVQKSKKKKIKEESEWTSLRTKSK